MGKRKNPAAVALGRKGGKIGGKVRAANLTPAQRSESARNAVMVRWGLLPVDSKIVARQAIRNPADGRIFAACASRWKRERGATSSVSQMAMCESYQRIIGMGQTALPLIFERLAAEKDEPDHWFWALRSITREDPVAEDDQGDLVAMAQAWLAWGREHGYVAR